jgi:hypothetical protein
MLSAFCTFARVDAPETSQFALSRRTMLGGAALISALGALGFDVLSAPPAAAAAPTTAAQVVALANAQAGKTLAQIQATAMFEEPWHSFGADWCANFVSWLLRFEGHGHLPLVSQMAVLGSQVATPAVGDIFVKTGQHTGIVTRLNPTWIVAGNEPAQPWWSTTAVSRPLGGSYDLFMRPNYASSRRRRKVFATVAATDNKWYFVNGTTGKRVQITSADLPPLRGLEAWFAGTADPMSQVPVTWLPILQNYVQNTL